MYFFGMVVGGPRQAQRTRHFVPEVEELLPAEWLILLRYFTSCGHVHPIFCEAVSRWLLNEKFGKLQLKQLEEVLNSLGYAGYLTTELGDEICNALKHLPTEAEEQVGSCGLFSRKL